MNDSKEPPVTYDGEVLSVLAYEFPFSKKKEIEDRIKNRLKEKKLGTYDANRTEVLRRLKNDLQLEVSKSTKSTYYKRSHGEFCDIRDFDVSKLTDDMSKQHPSISREIIENFVSYSVYVYYLR
jgi:hypothetical protein